MDISHTQPGTAALIAAFLIQGLASSFLATPAGAQDPGQPTAEERARAAALARADSIRATTELPPAGRGFSTDDLIRVPFRLLGAALTVVALPPLALYEVTTDMALYRQGMDLYEDLEDDGWHPSIGFIGSRSWPALVVRYDGLEPLFLEGGASLRGYTLARAGLLFGDTLRGAVLVGTHHALEALHTWGVGMGTPFGARSDYARTRRMAQVGVWTPLAPHVRLRVDGAWEEDHLGRGSDPDRPDLHDAVFADALFGLEETTYWRGGASLDLDWTQTRALQLVGLRALGRYDVFRGAGDTDSDFQRVRGDVRFYLPFTGRHLLAARGMIEEHLSEGGAGVPFHRLAMLGDDDGLRGYTSRRFRGRALLAAMLEWRYEVWFHPGDAQYRVEGFAFVDHGAVGPSLGEVDAFETTPGFGLRFINAGLSWLETYVAWGGDRSPRFDVTLGASF